MTGPPKICAIASRKTSKTSTLRRRSRRRDQGHRGKARLLISALYFACCLLHDKSKSRWGFCLSVNPFLKRRLQLQAFDHRVEPALGGVALLFKVADPLS